MTELLTAAQMRAIEEAAIASGEVTGLELMERAGRGVVEAIFEEWPELAGQGGGAAPTPPGYLGQDESRRAVVLCGPGNNGGDGFVVARLLKERGWEVEVFLYGDAGKLPPDARVNYERWRGMGEVTSLPSAFEASSREPHVVVDALFGIGLTRPVSGLGLTFLDMAEERLSIWPNNRIGIACVAIDLPSGVCSDSGRALKAPDFRGLTENVAAVPSAQVDLTVTFHAPKQGHVLGDGPRLCGKLVVKNIGLEKFEWPHSFKMESMSEVSDARPKYCLDLSKRAWDNHKYTHGHALILSGPPGRTGAARLAARGALRIGAGLVTVGAAPAAIPEHAAQLNAIMLREVADGDGLRDLLADGRINALCLGPGMGTGEREAGLLAAALEMGAAGATSGGVGGTGPASGAARRADGRSLVLDADALTILAQNPALFAALHPNCVLTPHAGEFARLFPDIAERLAAPATRGPAYSKVDATREAAARAGCVVLFKGPDTVIADPSGRCSINSAHYDRAAPWLATAGSGDVLAGFIAGLLARGIAPMQAAETAAWLHVECARSFGPGLIAEDLPEELPKVFRALGL
jgi:hydroxyethylthiazole kinase-like uncharacterized protein yjeF